MSVFANYSLPSLYTIAIQTTYSFNTTEGEQENLSPKTTEKHVRFFVLFLVVLYRVWADCTIWAELIFEICFIDVRSNNNVWLYAAEHNAGGGRKNFVVVSFCLLTIKTQFIRQVIHNYRPMS